MSEYSRGMLASLALAAILTGPTTTELTPTDDIWVYPHASDQKDAYLRVWSVGNSDLAADQDEMEQVSYAYLRFDVGKVPAGKITEAKLIVTSIANPTYTLEMATKNPLIVRPVVGDFTEKGWNYEAAVKVKPQTGAEAIFGKGAPDAIPTEKEFTITIDLLKGPNKFADFLRKSGVIGISLSSSMDVAGNESRPVYKLFSKDAETAAKRPVLRIVTE